MNHVDNLLLCLYIFDNGYWLIVFDGKFKFLLLFEDQLICHYFNPAFLLKASVIPLVIPTVR